MNPNGQPQITFEQTPEYKDTYANNVQVRFSTWDFHLVFGLATADAPDEVTIRNQNGIFLSPQQTKVLWNILGMHLAQYEQAFGPLNIEPNLNLPQGPVN